MNLYKRYLVVKKEIEESVGDILGNDLVRDMRIIGVFKTLEVAEKVAEEEGLDKEEAIQEVIWEE